ncbi:CCA tRNA nucleotidyltransferase [Sphaerochaeta sp. PS]|uniref:CCA tRNA nucleotidyltransferase n=1 Tax=Sphaerochaeta sp. PS TaxID=3076336 RepID=UPI0028A3E248|nr:HD domain-containing protein [Sphaerochaeta sp. PS]MDT4761396.1 HD domain-containing protein [Sphaerochaeta sp. PS]
MNAFQVPSAIRRFSSRFKEAGFSLYIVGGAIRDFLLGLESEDYDFTTDAEPNEVMALFGHVIPTGIEHGTVTVVFEKQMFEVTTFRSEGSYFDGRHPSSVSFIRNLEEDLKRRDFTINAFAADCTSGTIIDLNGGREDLKKKVIRAIGVPQKRFEEDALRIMRACRIASKLDFTIEPETLKAMAEAKENLKNVSAERIREELFKLVDSPYPTVGLAYMHRSGVLTTLLPTLAKGDGIEQGGMHHQDILQHNIAACQAAATMGFPLPVRLACLFHDMGKSEVIMHGEGRNTFYNHETVSAKQTQSIMDGLKASREQTRIVSHLVREHMFNYQSSWTDSAVRRFINKVGLEDIPLLFQVRIADQIAIHGRADTTLLDELQERIESILEARDALGIKDLAVNGNDLMVLGIPKGKMIGEILSYLLETVLDDPAQNTRDQLLTIARSYCSRVGTTTLS